MKTEWISFIFFGMAALIHVGLFILESFLFQKDGAQAKLGLTKEQHAAVKPWALNQGYYNLFLAIGTFVGLSLVLKKQILLAGVLTSFCGLSMMGAGTVLWFTVPRSRKFALLQILPPLIGFAFLFFHISSSIGR
ncbi:MAG: DUF1304 domain-containing protein [Bdellovibrionales bacterium]|nr:DUF1304 domain-containing protein [Bdellovibrionales bacterium]